ncbi:hypothetical protein HMI55_003783 [Coelomomyces lativittatus]|nr:hypothetical protein HMI55_003783 [Coelomomyces lativittatus]
MFFKFPSSKGPPPPTPPTPPSSSSSSISTSTTTTTTTYPTQTNPLSSQVDSKIIPLESSSSPSSPLLMEIDLDTKTEKEIKSFQLNEVKDIEETKSLFTKSSFTKVAVFMNKLNGMKNSTNTSTLTSTSTTGHSSDSNASPSCVSPFFPSLPYHHQQYYLFSIRTEQEEKEKEKFIGLQNLYQFHSTIFISLQTISLLHLELF